MRRFRVAVVLGVAATSLGLAAPVAADCQPAGPIEEVLPTARVAFVGVVTAVDGPVARFAVREVWAGNVPATVEVRGLTDDAGGVDAGFGAGFSEDDRHWTPGEAYLVVPFVEGDVLRDHICTATTEWRAELTALRPGDARELEPDGTGGDGPPTELIVIGAVGGVILLGSALAFRRR